MSGYNKFLDHVYSDELSQIDPEEINLLMDEEGYQEWSEQLEEQEAWKGAKEFSGILIKEACEHRDCPHTKCVKSIRLGGIEI
jgi:hypothetical protein